MSNSFKELVPEDYIRKQTLTNCERFITQELKELESKVLGAQANEIYFTAGGSESDNWALKATAEAYKDKGNHIITSKIEHHAILHTCEYLEKRGFEVSYIDVDENGVIISCSELVKIGEIRQGIRDELRIMSDKVEKLTGVRPTLFRPPYGDYNDSVVSTVRSWANRLPAASI